jgi:hypothetical protein
MTLKKVLIKSLKLITLILIVIFVYFKAKDLVKTKIIEEASKRGFQTEFEKFEIGFLNIKLFDVNIKSCKGFAQIKEIIVSPEYELKINGGFVNIKDKCENKKSSQSNNSTLKITIKANNIDLTFQDENKSLKANIVEASKETNLMKVMLDKISFSYKGIEGKSDKAKIEILPHLKSIEFGKIEIDKLNYSLIKEDSKLDKSNNHSLESSNLEISTKEIEVNDIKAWDVVFKQGTLKIKRIDYKNKIDAQFVSIIRDKNTAKWGAEILQVNDEKLSSEPIHFMKLGGEISLINRIIEGKIEQIPFNFKIDFDSKLLGIELKQTDCEDLVDFLPYGFKGEISKNSVKGNVSISSTVHYDKENPLNSKVDLKVKNRCRKWDLSEEFSLKNFYTEFKHTIYSSDGTKKEILMGPNTENWVPISNINSNLVDAVITCEDPSFGDHNGVIPLALKISLEDNLKSGSFKRGGSTIPMQLAKNLWLGREKTIARKIQELFLAMWLTQEIDEMKIIELYLNVIEFGPDIYGIGPASKYYFGKYPARLTLAESVFLASILPSPKKQRFESNNKLTKSSLNHIQNIMKLMKTRNQISEKELMKGFEEWPEFRKNGELNLTKDEFEFLEKIQTN